MTRQTWERIKNLIADALERRPSEREAFLEARCAPDVWNEVQTWLKSYRSSFLEGSPHGTVVAADDELSPGTKVGTYVIVDTLGHGGMGQVYLAKSALHHKVALKRVFTSPQASADERMRILNEAVMMAQINHPNVATIHHIVEEGTSSFIVMEYVEGENLSTRMRRERLSIDRAVVIGRQLAAAVTAAHAKGIVHRDLKPANVQLTVDGTVKVLDFGVATVTSAFTTLTAGTVMAETPGVQPGTPGYMSPEQLLSDRIDERSDVFSLGIILFEMVTAQRAYPISDPLELATAVMRPLRRADVVDPTVPGALADLIVKAVAIDPAARFQTAAEFEAALAGLHRQTQPSPSGGLRLARWALGGLAALVIIGLSGFLTSAQYDLTFGRGPEFGDRSVWSWFYWGSHSLIPPFAYLLIALIAARIIAAVWRLARGLGVTVEPITGRTRAAVRKAVNRLGNGDTAAPSQLLLLVQVVAAAGAFFWFRDVISALWQPVDQADAVVFAVLDFANVHRLLYVPVLSLLAASMVIGWRKLFERGAIRSRVERSTVAAGAAVILVILFLVQLPYRTFRSSGPIGSYAGMRCYQTGEAGDSVLLFCPDTEPPRVHKVKKIEYQPDGNTNFFQRPTPAEPKK